MSTCSPRGPGGVEVHDVESTCRSRSMHVRLSFVNSLDPSTPRHPTSPRSLQPFAQNSDNRPSPATPAHLPSPPARPEKICTDLDEPHSPASAPAHHPAPITAPRRRLSARRRRGDRLSRGPFPRSHNRNFLPDRDLEFCVFLRASPRRVQCRDYTLFPAPRGK